MRHRLLGPVLLLVLAVVLSAGSATLRAELDDGTWKDARTQAKRLMKDPGKLASKQKTIRTLAKDDSERSAKLLCDWARASLRLRHTTLAKDLEEAEEDFTKLVRILRKAYDTLPPNRVDDKTAYDRAKAAVDRARALADAEDATLRSLAQAFRSLRSPEAVGYLLRKGEDQVARRDGSAFLVVGMVRAYREQPVEAIREFLFERLGRRSLPEVRVLVLDWIAAKKPAGGYEAIVGELEAEAPVVRRAAVQALRELDEPRAVEPLIEARAAASGQLADEIESVLTWFTGQSFERDVHVWRRWWAEHGVAWLRAPTSERFPTPPKASEGGTTSFYGVRTRSQRIVFVLDRSGSMESPASTTSRRRSPVTGPGAENEPEIEGDTKIEVAKNQLAWSIDSLPETVRFNVIFYSSDVQVWREPPELVSATPEHKKAARDWIADLEAQGSTRTFDALLRALAYAAGPGGADTIFLLSDGSPTAPEGGKPLQGEALEAEYGAFLDRNKLYRCVVHTIGVGPQHNRWLMQRIARDTGGTYKDVGR